MYNYRLMIICQISARKYPCRVQVITESFLQKLRNSAKTSVTMDDLSAEIYTHDVQIKKAGKESTQKVLPLLILYCLCVTLAPSFMN
jgi:hypothetical protein